MPEPYSVLMSVYHKERPEYLKTSMESMFSQTVSTDDFVLVCDGPLTKELDDVIARMAACYQDRLHVVRLDQNSGLGNALNEGLKHCKYELVARMDSDDISYPDRCERQLAEFEADPALDIVSGTIEEFVDSPKVVTGKRVLPKSYDEICAFSKKRNPFNHPAVMFRKTAVLEAGGYREEYHLFEDYYLWIRMLMQGCHAKNMMAPLLYMRTPVDSYLRRGGKRYAKDMLRFHRWMRRVGWTGSIDYLTSAVPHAIVCIFPNAIRGKVYEILRH